jgi:23S rRNA pseudouridine955/2504/2580 synthase
MSRIPKKKTMVRYDQVEADQAGRRIDNYLASHFKGLPRKRLYQMLRKGEVRVNGRRIRQDYRLEMGDRIRIPPVSQAPPASAGTAPPADYLLDRVRDSVLYEDDRLLALNKPAGIVVHSGSGRSFGVIELLRHLRGEQAYLQLVHRLDRETSGVLLLAKDRHYLQALQDCLRQGRLGKRYLALLCGRLPRPVMEVDRPLERDRLRSGERLTAVSAAGKTAFSRFRLKRAVTGGCLVEVDIGTGRTHQIRVHAAAIGHPVAGDDKYGDRDCNRTFKQRGLRRLFLHAAAVRIPALLDRPARRLEAPLPTDLAAVLKARE